MRLVWFLVEADGGYSKSAAPALDEIKVHVKFKLSALWSSVMFCYIYGDYFQLYQPGQLQAIIAGKMAFFVITQGVLLGRPQSWQSQASWCFSHSSCHHE